MDEENIRIFIVDDEPNIVEWLVENVEWEAYNCVVAGHATDAQTALGCLEKYPVDVLITDICMPKLSGLELVRKVREKYEDMFFIVISSYDKFEYVKEAFQYGIVDYCLKPIEVNELYECLKSVETARRQRLMDRDRQSVDFYRNSVFQRLLRGGVNDFHFEEQCELAGIDLEVPFCQLAVIKLRHRHKDECVSVIDHISKLGWEGIYAFPDTCMNVVLLFLNDTGCDRETERRIQEVLRHENILFDTLLCIGRPLENYMQVAASYEACCDFVNAAFLFTGHMLRMEEYPYEKYQGAFKSKELRKLAYILKTNQEDRLVQIMKNILAGLPKKQKVSELICLAVFLNRSISALYPFEKRYIPPQALQTQSSIEKMLGWMVDFYEGNVGLDKMSEEVDVHRLVRSALKEIEVHYSDNKLSLAELSKAYSVSARHLGRLFKEQTGHYFNDYLLDYRLKKAEIHLAENELNMSQLSEKVGFSSQSYFTKMFRHNFGMSPSEYRRRCCEEYEKHEKDKKPSV